MPCDNVDGNLYCVRLEWERHEEEQNVRETCKVLALCSLESVRWRVLIVNENAFFELLQDTVPDRAAIT